VIPSKGFRSGEVLFRTFILVYVIEVTCVIISCQLWYNRRDTCQTNSHKSFAEANLTRKKIAR
jgi:hypothetical protein